MFCEPDLDCQATALATEPIDSDRRNVLSKFKVWKEG